MKQMISKTAKLSLIAGLLASSVFLAACTPKESSDTPTDLMRMHAVVLANSLEPKVKVFVSFTEATSSSRYSSDVQNKSTLSAEESSYIFEAGPYSGSVKLTDGDYLTITNGTTTKRLDRVGDMNLYSAEILEIQSSEYRIGFFRGNDEFANAPKTDIVIPEPVLVVIEGSQNEFNFNEEIEFSWQMTEEPNDEITSQHVQIYFVRENCVNDTLPALDYFPGNYVSENKTIDPSQPEFYVKGKVYDYDLQNQVETNSCNYSGRLARSNIATVIDPALANDISKNSWNIRAKYISDPVSFSLTKSSP